MGSRSAGPAWSSPARRAAALSAVTAFMATVLALTSLATSTRFDARLSPATAHSTSAAGFTAASASADVLTPILAPPQPPLPALAHSGQQPLFQPAASPVRLAPSAPVVYLAGTAVLFAVLLVTKGRGRSPAHCLAPLPSTRVNEAPVRLVAADEQRLWKAAIKLPMYTVVVSPTMVAAGWLLAFQPEAFQPLQLALFLVSAVSLLVWENLGNDAFDDETGVDINKPHSVVRLTGQRDKVLLLANLALLVGLSLMSVVAYRSTFDVLALVLGCCALGYVYQGPPFRLSFQGLGEPLCFLAFGPLACKAALEALGGDVAWATAWQVGAGPALAITLVLFCSHFHQVAEDQAFGKKSPVVRLGTERAAALIPVFVAATLGLETLPVLTGDWPVPCLLALLGLPVGIKLARLLGTHHAEPKAIQNSKFLALQFQVLSSLGLAAGFAIGGLL